MQCKQELRSLEDKEISQNFEKEHILHRHSMYMTFTALKDSITLTQDSKSKKTVFLLSKD